jgi:hypothetical protein
MARLEVNRWDDDLFNTILLGALNDLASVSIKIIEI